MSTDMQLMPYDPDEPTAFSLALDPTGEVYSLTEGDLMFREFYPDSQAAQRILAAFRRGVGEGLLYLGSVELQTPLPAVASFWRGFARRFCTLVAQNPEAEDLRGEVRVEFPDRDVEMFLDSAPPMFGGEYLSEDVLRNLWDEMHRAFSANIGAHTGTVSEWFQAKNSLWHMVGRVCFNLAEYKDDPDHPFAFLATFSTRVSAGGRVSHKPLGAAVEEGARAGNRALLVRLLEPVEVAAREAAFLQSLVASKAIFSTQYWTPGEAYRFLKEIPVYEESGVMVRVPPWWRPLPRRAKAKAVIGDETQGLFGVDSLMSFRVEVSLDGEPLTRKEIETILRGVDGLVLIKGKWIEVDREQLSKALAQWEELERTAQDGGITFVQAMRALSGANQLSDSDNLAGDDSDASLAEWSQVVAGRHLSSVLEQLRNPELIESADISDRLHATLRPYQTSGVNWVWFLASLGLGACLADDMGLGKTIQVISFFLRIAKIAEDQDRRLLHLVVAPASLIGNWQREFEKFAPSLKVFVAHSSACGTGVLKNLTRDSFADFDVVVTTYASSLRFPWVSQIQWDALVLDEAQSIKNPDAKQTRAIKAINARARVALTGTPIENRLTDLWSLFDFLNPGLLGSRSEFESFAKNTRDDRSRLAMQSLRKLVRPYILRRMKTDRRIISDLPDKVEMKAACALSKRQIALYEQAVDDLKKEMQKQAEQKSGGMDRRALILKTLLRLKQICNHPSQWLGDGSWEEKDSGKMVRLREICEEIASRQEKVIVFTQFREITEVLAGFLTRVFGRKGLVLHGGTRVGERAKMVESFNAGREYPFFVLSIKAGGTGLNLTSANHVVHFDRWWNPAVETQATDRAFRIGQKKNVMVHKFVTQGTLEENIDLLIEQKRSLAGQILDGDGEVPLTELSNEEILKLVSLDLNAVGTD